MTLANSLTSRTALGVYLVIAVVAGVFAGTQPFRSGEEKPYPALNIDANNIAIKGYDTVAYFTLSKAVKGKSEFSHNWQDATWHFASAANRDLFRGNAERYAPQYGGYCALGLSSGEVADIDPEAWTITNGKLYFNKSQRARVIWRKAPIALIGNANYNWKKYRGRLRNVMVN